MSKATSTSTVFAAAALAICLAGCSAPTEGRPDLAAARWLLLGPFPNSQDQGCPGFEEDFLAELGGEVSAAPTAGLLTGGRRWTWAAGPEGRIDLLAALEGATNAVGYAYTEIRSAKGGETALKLGSDDGIKAWVNGELVWSNHIHRGLRVDEDAVPVSLLPGQNRLLLKVDQGSGGWAFAARVRPLVEEESEWAEARNPGLQIRLAEGGLSFLVTTMPALAVSHPVEVTVVDSEDAVALTVSTVTGRVTPLALPEGARGAYRFVARSAGGRSGVSDGEALGLVGDRAAIVRQTAVLARSLHPAEEPAASTLEYLAELLEGKLHASLSGNDQVNRAIETVLDIHRSLATPPWRPDALRGLRQWAYRSPIDGSLQPYSVYLPESYDAARLYPLVLALHGYTDNDWNIASAVSRGSPADFIVVAPYGRGDMGYRSVGERDVLDVLERVRTLYSVDPDRISLMGISMGGMGAWRIGQLHTDLFAAIAPFCGWTGTVYLGNLGNTPIQIVHGGADTTVPGVMDRQAANALRARHAPVTYYELAGVDHDAWGAWTLDGGSERLFSYLWAKKLDRWPTTIDFTVEDVAYGRHFWIRVDELSDWPRAANVTARITANRAVSVAATGVRTFALDLTHPGLAQRGEITISLEGRSIPARAGVAEVLLTRDDGSDWVVAPPVAAGRARHTDGGFLDLFSGPLTLVYGTMRSDRVQILRAVAESMADWSPTAQIPIGSKTGRFRVRSDTEVTQDEIQAGNLVLLGDAGENHLSGRTLQAMPLRWSNDGLEAAGKLIPGAALLAVHLNPDAPGFRTAVLTLPAGLSASDRVLYYAMLRARGYNVDGTATRVAGGPDVVVYNDASALNGGSAVWSGVWNRSWSQLREVRP